MTLGTFPIGPEKISGALVRQLLLWGRKWCDVGRIRSAGWPASQRQLLLGWVTVGRGQYWLVVSGRGGHGNCVNNKQSLAVPVRDSLLAPFYRESLQQWRGRCVAGRCTCRFVSRSGQWSYVSVNEYFLMPYNANITGLCEGLINTDSFYGALVSFYGFLLLSAVKWHISPTQVRTPHFKNSHSAETCGLKWQKYFFRVIF